MSIVQVFVGDQMALIAHLVDRHTIGKPDYYHGVKVKVNFMSIKYSNRVIFFEGGI